MACRIHQTAWIEHSIRPQLLDTHVPGNRGLEASSYSLLDYVRFGLSDPSLLTAEPLPVLGGRQESVDAVVVALRAAIRTRIERGAGVDATVQIAEPEVVAGAIRRALQVDPVIERDEVVIVVEFIWKVAYERKPEGTRLLPELRLVPHGARHMHARRVVTGKVASQEAGVERGHVIGQLSTCRIAVEEVPVLLLHEERRVVNRIGAARVGWWVTVKTLLGL